MADMNRGVTPKYVKSIIDDFQVKKEEMETGKRYYNRDNDKIREREKLFYYDMETKNQDGSCSHQTGVTTDPYRANHKLASNFGAA